jgi:hypothetical protein
MLFEIASIGLTFDASPDAVVAVILGAGFVATLRLLGAAFACTCRELEK